MIHKLRNIFLLPFLFYSSRVQKRSGNWELEEDVQKKKKKLNVRFYSPVSRWVPSYIVKLIFFFSGVNSVSSFFLSALNSFSFILNLYSLNETLARLLPFEFFSSTLSVVLFWFMSKFYWSLSRKKARRGVQIQLRVQGFYKFHFWVTSWVSKKIKFSSKNMAQSLMEYKIRFLHSLLQRRYALSRSSSWK